jgi:hypothetical protein
LFQSCRGRVANEKKPTSGHFREMVPIILRVWWSAEAGRGLLFGVMASVPNAAIVREEFAKLS